MIDSAAAENPQAPVFRPPLRARFRRWLVGKLPILVVGVLTSLLIVVFFWDRIFVAISAGEAGVLYRLFTGTETRVVYAPGLHIVAPWNTMTRYETRTQVAMHGFNVLSVRGLTVRLELAIRYRPDYEQLGLLHQGIGPNYEHRVVVPQTESVLRRELGLHTAENIYTNVGGVLTEAIALAREEVGRNFVQTEDIVIRSISLPPIVKEAIEDKLTQREVLESYVFRLQTAVEEAERLRTEARGIRDYQAAVDATLSERLLQHTGIRATKELAVSSNARVVLIGGGEDGLPLIPGAYRIARDRLTTGER